MTSYGKPNGGFKCYQIDMKKTWIVMGRNLKA